MYSLKAWRLTYEMAISFMADTINDTQKKKLTFSKKIWLAAGIISLVVVFLLLFKTLFSLILLMLAALLISVYFHGFAQMLQKIKIPVKASVPISVIFNLLLIVAFFWFVGARLEQQVSQLTDTLPQTIQAAKEKLNQSPVGSKLISYLQSSGNSKKNSCFCQEIFLLQLWYSQ